MVYTADRTTLEHTKKELCAIQTKYDHAANELSEYKVKVQAKEERLNELKREIDTLKSENSTMNALIVALRNKIRELECELNGVESVHTKADITITSLQNDNKCLQTNVLELESRIRTHMMEREEAERKAYAINNKLTELASKISTITGAKITNDVAGIDLMIKKVTEIVDDCTMYRGKLLTKNEKLDSLEKENKADRETINRLVNELNKIEKDQANFKLTSQNLKVVSEIEKHFFLSFCFLN